MKFVPRPYQALAIDHMLTHPRCAAWLAMGMGKTVSALMAIRALQVLDGMGPALVLAPLRVARSSWPDEVAKWDELRGMHVVCLSQSTVKRREEALAQRADVYTMNYELLPWLVSYLEVRGKPWPFDIIVADEATRLKSFRLHSGGMRAHALSKVAWQSKHFIELTGTPAPNGYLDLWGQIWFLDGGKRLGTSMKAYQERWFTPKRVGANAFAVRWEIMPGSEEQIQKRIADITIKLNAEDWFDIKEPIVSPVEVTLPEEAKKLYRKMETDLFLELAGNEIEASNAAVKTMKCLQIASGALYTEGKAFEEIHDAKLDALESVVNEASGPVLVAYQFKHDAARILKRFKGARLLDKNPRTIRDWNAGRISMLLAHPASCGHGLSLQDGGNVLVFFSTGWSLEEHDQIIERIGPTRQAQAGHPRPVFVYSIVAKGTLDEAVQRRIQSKREVLDLLMERRKACKSQSK